MVAIVIVEALFPNENVVFAGTVSLFVVSFFCFFLVFFSSACVCMCTSLCVCSVNFWGARIYYTMWRDLGFFFFLIETCLLVVA